MGHGHSHLFTHGLWLLLHYDEEKVAVVGPDNDCFLIIPKSLLWEPFLSSSRAPSLTLLSFWGRFVGAYTLQTSLTVCGYTSPGSCLYLFLHGAGISYFVDAITKCLTRTYFGLELKEVQLTVLGKKPHLGYSNWSHDSHNQGVEQG